MPKALSETRPGRVVDVILAAVILLAVLDHFSVVEIASTSIYIFFFITPLGFLRLYVDYRINKRPTKQTN
ncbi:hypothetical protein AMS69_14005 [Haloarcula rubripromontorii]|uniref:Uncharacterized protein n=1 Tax=Haloarcula rubripromontorii TaxID=1705562 RepID=A0A0M9AI45_9EURY|nr:hypothetical protein AMS69_14005 [Haloarcula rubripromontorii]